MKSNVSMLQDWMVDKFPLLPFVRFNSVILFILDQNQVSSSSSFHIKIKLQTHIKLKMKILYCADDSNLLCCLSLRWHSFPLCAPAIPYLKQSLSPIPFHLRLEKPHFHMEPYSTYNDTNPTSKEKPLMLRVSCRIGGAVKSGQALIKV